MTREQTQAGDGLHHIKKKALLTISEEGKKENHASHSQEKGRVESERYLLDLLHKKCRHD